MGGGCFVKKWKMGVFFLKSGPFLNAGCIKYSISIFYFTFYLFEGGAYAPNTRACAYGRAINIRCQSCFAIDLPSCVLKRRQDKFILRCISIADGFC